ncbi:hypothetical protein CRUP_001222 [Coryphaenoides rupestris]|nr:hypothetical protein CRUP_001222 [Coryphaenoides rupestris]
MLSVSRLASRISRHQGNNVLLRQSASGDELVTVKTPAFAESVTEGDTSVQVPSPAAGVIEELLVEDGGRVEGGMPLFKLRQGAAPIAATATPALVAPAPAKAAPARARSEDREQGKPPVTFHHYD